MMFDVSHPESIQLVGQFSPGGNAEDLILVDNIAYVAFFDRGLYSIDISDPGYPKKLGHIQTPGNARGIARDGSTLYIADWLSGVQVIDVSTPAQLQLIGSFDTAAAWGLALKNQFAFVMDWWGGLCVLDISQPATPTLAGRYQHRDRIHGISTQDKVAYAASGLGGLQIFDIKNPLNPTWMTGIDFDAGATRVVTGKQRAYVALNDRHIAIIDISDPYTAYPLAEIRSPYPITDLLVQGSWLVVNHGSKGMTLYRLDGKYADKPRQQLRIKAGVNSVTTSGEQSLAVARADGLISIYAQAGDKKPLKEFRHAATLLRSYQNFLVSYEKNTGIDILDRDGKSISHIDAGQTVVDMQIYDSNLALINDQQQLTLIDLTDIKEPVIKTQYRMLSPLSRITANNGTLYFSGNTSITALRPLPASTWENTDNNHYRLNFTADMPTGSYDVHIDSLRISNAVNIEPPRFSKPKFTMDDLNKALKKIHQQTPP